MVKSEGCDILQIVTAVIWVLEKNLQAFNVKQNLNRQQIEFFAEDFIGKYGHESLADLKLMFQNARTGKYGELKGYIDSALLWTWFRDFLGEKAEARQRRHEKLKSKYRERSESKKSDNKLFEELRNTIIEAQRQNDYDKTYLIPEYKKNARACGFLVHSKSRKIKWNGEGIMPENEAVKRLVKDFKYKLIKPNYGITRKD